MVVNKRGGTLGLPGLVKNGFTEAGGNRYHSVVEWPVPVAFSANRRADSRTCLSASDAARTNEWPPTTGD